MVDLGIVPRFYRWDGVLANLFGGRDMWADVAFMAVHPGLLAICFSQVSS
jgi:hypothetical protein